jgi:hypothetical protein
MKTIFSTLAILSLIILGGCESYVQNIDPQINSFDDALLNNENETDFIITGIKGKFADSYGQLSVMTDGLSDELLFDFNVPNATYPQYNEIDRGIITLNNNSVIDGEIALGQLRFFADTLVGRTYVIAYTDSTKMIKGRYYGYLFGAIARYFYASYFGLEEERGGGCINLSPFIPSVDMYALAMEKLDSALQYAQNPYEGRVVHSVKARIDLILGKNAEAATEASMGMVNGDDPLTALYNSQAPNFWWVDAGNSRVQWVVDERFNAYITADSNEVSRIQITPITGNDGTTIYHYQVKYPEDKSSIPFITWQESELIQAEVLIRNNQNTDALTHINNVRVSHGLSARTETSLDSVYIERDKELFCTGNRLIDQRRFDKWHLPSGTWKFLPITQRERNANPNLH